MAVSPRRRGGRHPPVTPLTVIVLPAWLPRCKIVANRVTFPAGATALPAGWFAEPFSCRRFRLMLPGPVAVRASSGGQVGCSEGTVPRFQPIEPRKFVDRPCDSAEQTPENDHPRDVSRTPTRSHFPHRRADRNVHYQRWRQDHRPPTTDRTRLVRGSPPRSRSQRAGSAFGPPVGIGIGLDLGDRILPAATTSSSSGGSPLW